MKKWKLLLTTLPYVAVAVGIKVVLEAALGFGGVVDFGDMGLVLTGGIFLIGFMLAGTMADYKEAERLPAEIAGCLEGIEETLDTACASKPALDPVALRASCLATTTTICDWISRKVPVDEVYASLTALEQTARAVEKAGGATPLAARVLIELQALRKHVTRVYVISRTAFLATGYALMDTLVALVLVLVLLSKFKSPLAGYMLVGFVSLVYVYMVRLIRDIDDPFEYSPDGEAGAAEVELFPLLEYRDRLAQRVSGSRG